METCGFLDVFTETDLESNPNRFTTVNILSQVPLCNGTVYSFTGGKMFRYLSEYHTILLYLLFFLCPTGNIVGEIYRGCHRDLLKFCLGAAFIVLVLAPSLCTCHIQVHDFVCVCTGKGMSTLEHPPQFAHSCPPSLATAPITMTGACFILGCSMMGN